MPSPPIVTLPPRPVIGHALPRGEPVLAPEVSPAPDARRVGAGSRRDLSRERAAACWCGAALVVLALLASLLGCSARADAPPPPPVDMPALLERVVDLEVRALAAERRIAFWEGARAADLVARLHFRGGSR